MVQVRRPRRLRSVVGNEADFDVVQLVHEVVEFLVEVDYVAGHACVGLEKSLF